MKRNTSNVIAVHAVRNNNRALCGADNGRNFSHARVLAKNPAEVTCAKCLKSLAIADEKAAKLAKRAAKIQAQIAAYMATQK